jgi:hypothetical protein
LRNLIPKASSEFGVEILWHRISIAAFTATLPLTGQKV